MKTASKPAPAAGDESHPDDAAVEIGHRCALRYTAAYAALALVCGLVSELVARWAFATEYPLSLWVFVKPIAFVGITSPFIYAAIRRQTARTAAASATLRSSQARLQRMAEMSSDWYWETDATLKLTSVAGTRGHGAAISSTNLLGKHFTEIPHFVLLSMPVAEFEALRAAHKPYRNVRGRIANPKRGDAYVSISGEPRFGSDGSFIGYHGVTRDVTDEFCALERLRLSEANFRAIAEHPGIAKAPVLPDNTPIYANQSYCALLGYTAAEILAGNSVDFTHPDDIEATRAMIAQCVAGTRDAYHLRKRFIRKDGGIVWVELDAAAVRDADGSLKHLVVQTQDIGPRLAAEAALRETQERLSMMFDQAAMGISEVALDGRFLRVNPALCRILGYGESELLASAGWQITHPDDRQAGHDRMADAITGTAERYALEKRYLRRDGTVVWVELTAALARDENGEPAYFVSLTQDISQRKATETALRQSEARYRSVVNSLTEGVLLTGDDGKVLAYNPATMAIFGTDFAELVAQGPRASRLRMFDQSGLPISHATRPSALVRRSGTMVRDSTVRLVRSDNSHAWLRVTAVPVGALADGHSEVLIVLADVTAERASAAALRESESRYRSVIETMTEAILLLDADGQAIGSNPAATRVFGLSQAAVGAAGPYTPILRMFHSGGRELRIEERPSYRALKYGKSVIEEMYRASRPDGSMIWLQISAKPLPLGPDSANGVLITLADITARVEAEAALKAMAETLERRVAARTAELSQVNRELESFAYSVSHDLRAPLRAISGFASLLAEDERENLGADSAGLLDRIASNAERMGELIDDVLEYSRVTRIDRQREIADVNVIATEVMLRLATTQPDTRCVVRPLGRASADPAMLRQIFEALIGNAFKYSATVARPEIEIDVQVDHGTNWYRVRDNGVGFDMRYADRLFGMFQRMHSAADFLGTGVGLAIVKRLVERHGGNVNAHSVPGEGATFRFNLGPEAEAL